MIADECEEGILLLDNSSMSYSLNLNEYLINKGTLFKVVDVDINEEKNQAVLRAVVIPKEKWNSILKEKNKKYGSVR